MGKNLFRACLMAGCMVASMPLGAQEGELDEDRVNAILRLSDNRALVETDSSYDDVGDYPRATQLLRMRSRVLPHDEEIITNLIWMLGNMHYRGEAVNEGIRFMNDNPQNPDRALPLAQLYFEMKLFAKVPALLEEDILRDPPPHPNSFRMIGHSYRKMGFHKDELRVWEQCLKHYPDIPVFKMLRDRAAAKVLDR